MDSIRIKNMLEQNPIIVNESMQLIDGQHRLEAAKRMETAIYYTIVSDSGLSEIHLMNTNLKPWITEDFLDSYIDLGLKDYALLKEFIKHYDITIPIGVALLSKDGFSQNNNRTLHELFKSGKFEVYDLQKADETAKNLVALKPFTEDTVWKSREFVRAILKTWEKIDPKAFLEKVKSADFRIRRRVNAKTYLRDFEDIWNRKLSANQIRLY